MVVLTLTACAGGGGAAEVTDVATCDDEGTHVVHVAAGHLDADDVEELVVACGTISGAGADTGSFEVLRADGDGGYERTVDHALAASPMSVATGDLTADGVDDVVVTLAGASERTMVVGVSDGEAGIETTLEATTDFDLGATTVHDRDGDGVPDVLSTRTNRWFHNQGEPASPGPFEDDAFVGQEQASDLDRVDVDADGRPDVILRDVEAGVVHLHLADGTPAQQLPVGALVDDLRAVLAGGDLNGDGVLDLVVATPIDAYDSQVRVLVSQGSEQWELSDPIDGLDGRRAQLLAADLTGDGHLDLLEVPEADPDADDQGLTLVAGRGDGTFDDATSIGFDGFPYRAIVTGADRDGPADVVLIASADEDNRLVRLSGLAQD